jgi:hypothetical protein
MKRPIVALLLVLSFVGCIGLIGSWAAPSDPGTCRNEDLSFSMPQGSPDTTAPYDDGFGAGDRRSPYPPYHHNSQ